jgi:uncharacterized membrane protein
MRNDSDSISQNVDSIARFYEREERKLSRAQRIVERVGDTLGRPAFFIGIMGLIMAWIALNVAAECLGMDAIDPPPFFWLQGTTSLLALLTTIAVLIRQERLASLEARREHLDLQVNLLTEQKVTQLIHLLEELRRDLPIVTDRHDPQSEQMQRPTDPHRVLEEIDRARAISDGDAAAA